jgi:hypothetical protein
MAALDFSEFVKRHGLQLLTVANTDVFPGAVVDKARRGFLPQGHLREVLGGQPPGFWDTEMSDANLVYGSTERTISLGGHSSLSEMGVSVEGGLQAARSATFSITGVYARTFKNGEGRATMLALVPLIHALRRTDKVRWKLVNGKWIVTETYYATDATLTFETKRGANLKADVAEAGGVRVSGDGEVAWRTKNSFTITRNDRVPFGFRGWKV